jgi:hypothetical protein
MNVMLTTNKVGAYTELMKAFGKIGSTVHSDLLNSGNYMVGAGAAGDNDPSDRIPFSPFAIDLESFRHEIENGIDYLLALSRLLFIQLIALRLLRVVIMYLCMSYMTHSSM